MSKGLTLVCPTTRPDIFAIPCCIAVLQMSSLFCLARLQPSSHFTVSPCSAALLFPPSGSERNHTNTINVLKAPCVHHVPICFTCLLSTWPADLCALKRNAWRPVPTHSWQQNGKLSHPVKNRDSCGCDRIKQITVLSCLMTLEYN